MERYQSYYQTLLEQSEFQDDTKDFSISTEMAQDDTGSYTYAVILDHPRTSMHEIRALVIEDDTPYDQETRMMPSSGIFDDACSMIPNQVNRKDGFVKGIVLNGSTSHSPVDLRMLVEWKSETDGSLQRVYIERQISAEEKENSSDDAS